MARAPKFPPELIEKIRVAYETTPATLRELGKQFGVPYNTISVWAKERGWRRAADLPYVRDAAYLRADKASDINSAIELRSEVLIKHRAEWHLHRVEWGIGEKRDPKEGKVAAEMIEIRQRGERLAWGLTDNAASPAAIKITWIGEE